MMVTGYIAGVTQNYTLVDAFTDDFLCANISKESWTDIFTQYATKPDDYVGFDGNLSPGLH